MLKAVHPKAHTAMTLNGKIDVSRQDKYGTTIDARSAHPGLEIIGASERSLFGPSGTKKRRNLVADRRQTTKTPGNTPTFERVIRWRRADRAVDVGNLKQG